MTEEKNVEETKTVRRGRPPKSESTTTTTEKKTRGKTKSTNETGTPKLACGPVNGGSWSSPVPKQSLEGLELMHVEIMWIESALGTLPNNTELLSDYIASKAPDAKSKTEEIEAIGEDAVMDRTLNIYPKGPFMYDEKAGRFYDHVHPEIYPDGIPEGLTMVERNPFYYNYQIRGFFKDSCGLLARGDDTESSKMSAFRKKIDGGIFVFPRRVGIQIPETYINDEGEEVSSFDASGNLKVIQRPVLISGPTGSRTAIVASEMIPTGSSMKFTIGMTSKKFKPAVIEWLNYACVHGISGWRNSGMGICIWREITPEYLPYDMYIPKDSEEEAVG